MFLVRAFVLEPLGYDSMQLNIRARGDYRPRAALTAFFLQFEPAVLLMERKMLLGIKQRAKKARTGPRR